VGKVDHADDAVNQTVADRDEPIDRAEGEAVDQLLERVGQRPASCGGAARSKA